MNVLETMKRNKKYAVALVFALAIFSYVGVMIYAAAPSGGYAPGAELDPDCAPGDSDCVVSPGWINNIADDILSTPTGYQVGIGTDAPLFDFDMIGEFALATDSDYTTGVIGTDSFPFMPVVTSMVGSYRLYPNASENVTVLHGIWGGVPQVAQFNRTTNELSSIQVNRQSINIGHDADVFDPVNAEGMTQIILDGSGASEYITMHFISDSTNSTTYENTRRGIRIDEDGVAIQGIDSNTYNTRWNNSSDETLAAIFNDKSFAFGDENFEWDSVAAEEENKFFFDVPNQIIRMGSVDSTAWDAVNAGTRSIAFGFADPDNGFPAPIASGDSSFALGAGALASGDGSFAFGPESEASATLAIAFGYTSIASDVAAVALAGGTASGAGSFAVTAGTASGIQSFAGAEATAGGTQSFAFGNGAVASADRSVAIGVDAKANGIDTIALGTSSITGTFNGAIALGGNAAGQASVAIGVDAQAYSAYETALGTFETAYTPSSQTTFAAIDRLFNIGNGATTGSRSDAFTVLKNGKVGIGIDNFEDSLNQLTPTTALLQVDGDIAASGDVYAAGVMLTSDQRLKKNIEDISFGLDTINALRPVAYDMRNNNSHQFGFIAQEVQSELPDLVQENEYLSLNYIGIIPVLTKAVQELDIKLAAVESAAQTVSTGSLDYLRTWFADATNGIESLFAKRIATDELCVGSVCVTESEFMDMVSNYHSINNNSNTAPDDTADIPTDPEVLSDESSEQPVEDVSNPEEPVSPEPESPEPEVPTEEPVSVSPEISE